MDIRTDDTGLPDDGYALVREIKILNGRVEYLTSWAKDVKKWIAEDARRTRAVAGGEYTRDDGSKRVLRVDHRPAAVVKRFQYDPFIEAMPREIVNRYVEFTPPKYPKALRLASANGRRSREWSAFESRGAELEARETPGRNEWLCSPMASIGHGLFVLDQKAKTYQAAIDARRDVLTEMAIERAWPSGMTGKDDGRVLLSATKPSRELRDRKAALRAYPGFFKPSNRAAGTAIGFYVPGASLDDEDL